MASKQTSMLQAAIAAAETVRKPVGVIAKLPNDVQRDLKQIARHIVDTGGNRSAALSVIHSYGHKQITEDMWFRFVRRVEREVRNGNA